MKKAVLLIITIIFTSCSDILFNDPAGVITKKIDGDFKVISVSGIYNIVLVQDSADMLVFSGSNNLSSITAHVENDTLRIDDGKKISFNTEKNTLEIHFSNILHLITVDPVKITNTDTLRQETFRLWAIGEISEVDLKLNVKSFEVAGSANTLGELVFKGKTDFCSFFNRYGCKINAGGLNCRVAYITNESIGDIYVNAREKIKAAIKGPGNIYYYGTPVIEEAENKGAGKIIAIKP